MSKPLKASELLDGLGLTPDERTQLRARLARRYGKRRFPLARRVRRFFARSVG